MLTVPIWLYLQLVIIQILYEAFQWDADNFFLIGLLTVDFVVFGFYQFW